MGKDHHSIQSAFDGFNKEWKIYCSCGWNTEVKHDSHLNIDMLRVLEHAEGGDKGLAMPATQSVPGNKAGMFGLSTMKKSVADKMAAQLDDALIAKLQMSIDNAKTKAIGSFITPSPPAPGSMPTKKTKKGVVTKVYDEKWISETKQMKGNWDDDAGH